MNSYRINDETYYGSWSRRAPRVVLGTAAFSAILTGYEDAPVAIFILSLVSIYCMITAILGQGLLDVLFRPAQTAAEDGAVSHPCNIAVPERVARGAVSGAALGSVLSGAFVLDAGDVFTLGAAGALLGLTATVAWCPVVAALQYLLSRRSRTFEPAAASTTAVISPTAGPIAAAAAVEPAADGQAQEAA